MVAMLPSRQGALSLPGKRRSRSWIELLLILAAASSAQAFQPLGGLRPLVKHSPTNFHRDGAYRSTTALGEKSGDGGGGGLGGILDFLFNPYESKIPSEISNEIYAAEANTQFAKERTTRVAAYTFVALLGVGLAFVNAFLGELRSNPAPDGSAFVLEDSVFAWAQANGLAKFIFLNKIGGVLCFFAGAGAGFMVDAELDTRRVNAEKIYEEMVRRREAYEKKMTKAERKQKKKKKKISGKSRKRMNALAEVMETTTETAPTVEEVDQIPIPTESSNVEDNAATPSPSDEKSGGVFGAVKDFYKRADSMAASQALLLNKKLEDAGVVDKITDESGLRVIGREAASELPKKEKNDEAPPSVS